MSASDTSLIERIRQRLSCYWRQGDPAPQLTKVELELLSEAADALTAANAKLAEAKELRDRLKMEAKIHAQEARTANHTIAEIYQIVTGATGEPGNWNGAEPVKVVMAKLAEYESVKVPE